MNHFPINPVAPAIAIFFFKKLVFKLFRKMKTFTIKYNNAGNDLIRPSLTINLKPKPRVINKANPNDDISVIIGK